MRPADLDDVIVIRRYGKNQELEGLAQNGPAKDTQLLKKGIGHHEFIFYQLVKGA